MPLTFVYGSLKEGFPNTHNNPGVRVPGQFRTRERLPLFLLGEGQVPCLVLSPGVGHQVKGEVYEVQEQSLVAMDRLERLGESNGYLRVTLEIESTSPDVADVLSAQVYVKSTEQAATESQRIGPIDEYTQDHAMHFKWQGLD